MQEKFESPGATAPQVSRSRFWVPRTGALDLSDARFLIDPTETIFRYRTERPQALPDLKTYRALGLLGEPGIGKSRVLEAEATRLVAEPEEQGAMSIHVDLRAFSSASLLVQRVFESAKIAEWKSGAAHLFLHLDSLDEALLRIDSIAPDCVRASAASDREIVGSNRLPNGDVA
jgi:hypothetical protein